MGLIITNPPLASILWGRVFKWIILCIIMSQQVLSLWRKGFIYNYQLVEQKFYLSPLLPGQCCMNWEPSYPGEMMGLCLATQIPALGIPGGLGRPGRALSELKGDRAPRTKQERQAQKLRKCGSSLAWGPGAWELGGGSRSRWCGVGWGAHPEASEAVLFFGSLLL